MVESCRIEGEDWLAAWTTQSGRTALAAVRGTLQIAGACVIAGGDGNGFGLGAASSGIGVWGESTDVRVLDGQVTAGQPSAWPIPAFFLAGTSTLRLSPRVVASGPGGVANVPVVPSPMPGLTGNSAAPGGTLTAVAATEPGDLVVLVVGLPGAPVAVPGFVDAFALDPAVHVFHTIGTQQGGAPVTGTIAVPNAAGLLGLRLNWQAACYGPVTGLQASNPVAALVR